MLECLSVHQTFLCLLHLANENCLRFERKINIPLEDEGEELEFKKKNPHDCFTAVEIDAIMADIPKCKKKTVKQRTNILEMMV
jgi:hypothetical protein